MAATSRAVDYLNRFSTPFWFCSPCQNPLSVMQSGMAKQPPQSDEDIANAAMQDIYTNVTSARESWRDYDMRYVLQRIIRAIREAKSAAGLLFKE